MAKIFYDHLISFAGVESTLKGYSLQKEEYDELVKIADETIHHRILNIILTKLPKEKHELFLESFYASPANKKLLDFLKKEAGPEVETEIGNEGKKVIKEIIAEINKSKRK